MAEEGPSKTDITAIFKRLRSLQSNKICFDCQAKNPTWASVTYGVFICIDCSAVHRSLGVHLSFVRSTQLDTNWTWLQIRAMQTGGNSNAIAFFQQHNCTSTDAQQKYNSRAAQLYREKLHHMAASAMRLHGTKVHIDTGHGEPPATPEKTEVDFFKEHEECMLAPAADADLSIQNGSLVKQAKTNAVSDGQFEGPNVESALSVSPTEAQKFDVRKTTIGQRKAPPKKGLGARKGLGAQKLDTSFNSIEQEAQKADQLKEKAALAAAQEIQLTKEEEEKRLATMHLAYKDLSIQQKQAETKMKQSNPKKAEQLERLGMGIGGMRSGGAVSHSAMSDMKVIQQDGAPTTTTSSHRDWDKDDFDDGFLGFASGPPKYKDSPFLSQFDKFEDAPSKSSWLNDKADKVIETIPPVERQESSNRSRRGMVPATPSGDEAQKKFGNAKSISSEQYFGPRDSNFERSANLNRFEGSASISSEDFFGGSSMRRSASADFYNTPNLYNIKEGVKDGVTKVAGRLSTIANGVVNSIQERYGY